MSDRLPEALPEPARGLLAAVLAITSELELPRALESIVDSACELTGARYGALGVIGPDRHLSAFITHGLDAEEREAVGAPPRGDGILGLLIDRAEPIRLSRLSEHPASTQLPPGHPTMTRFLGVPVRVRGTVFGNLYLTDKVDGSMFTEVDQELVVTLAQAAGHVIEKARAYSVSERQRALLESTTALHEVVQPPVDLAVVFPLVASGALATTRAVAVGVLHAGRLVAADGPRAERIPEEVERLGGRYGDGVLPVHRGLRPELVTVRPQLTDPLRILALYDAGGIAPEHELTQSWADQVALALDRAQALTERGEHLVVSDRERIARDLHDVVIQRLFATGLQLQNIRRIAVRSDVHERLDAAIAEVDGTIKDIRTTIFSLQHRPGAGLRAGATQIVGEYRRVLGFLPALRFAGPVDTVGVDVSEDVLAVLREALSNVSRHAAATEAVVEIEASVSELRLRVTDNGRGTPTGRPESGLANVRRRAALHGGTAAIGPAHPHGTVLEWRVDLP